MAKKKAPSERPPEWVETEGVLLFPPDDGGPAVDLDLVGHDGKPTRTVTLQFKHQDDCESLIEALEELKGFLPPGPSAKA